MDAQDQQGLSQQDILEGNQQKIFAASARYREPVVLTGILNRSRGRSWNTSWSRYYGDSINDTTFEASSLDQALQQGIRWLAGDTTQPGGGAFGGNEGLSSNRRNEGLIWISDVDAVGSYARIMALIDNVDGAQVYLQGMSVGNLQIAVQPRSAVGNVAQLLVNSNRVRSAGGSAVSGGQRPDVFLQYIR